AEHFVRMMDHGPVSSVGRMLERSAGHPEIRESLLHYMEDVMIEPLTAQLDGPDARARALLATTIMMGAGPIRSVLDVDELRTADREELIDRVTAVFRAALAPPS